MITINVVAIIAAMSIPSAITTFCFWLIEQKIQKRDVEEKKERAERQKEVDRREEAREKNEICLINCVGAALALGEATAKAVQRIPDAHCNGDMHEALEYARRVKHEQKEFLNEQSIKSIY
jgi:flagellar biosynthesis component FlhA